MEAVSDFKEAESERRGGCCNCWELGVGGNTEGLRGKWGFKSRDVKLEVEASVVVEGEVRKFRLVRRGRRVLSRGAGGAYEGSGAPLDPGLSKSASDGVSSTETGDGGDEGRLGVKDRCCCSRSSFSAGRHNAAQDSSLSRGPT